MAGQLGEDRPVVASSFTTTERRTADGMHLGWSPFVAALPSTGYEDVLQVHPPTRQVTRAKP
ncbi:hypothetical protein [Streptomyces sp. NRRL S-813]|uniref:hypothetical protein n=1 Tax=Streptomyces sp. NRRL S-813 TaxID=1463919 RepID=UPI0004C2A942|nr:hypothetical protein [Streptomyces sp. NRRL S-813]